MLIKEKPYSGVLFVHIPKTAGTSIFSIVNRLGMDPWKRDYPRRHDPYFYLKEKNTIDESTFSFAVVRDPYTRTYSCFKQFNKTNQTGLTFSEYLINIQNDVISLETPMLHLPQSFYVLTSSGENCLSKTYKFESLNELERDFGWTLEVENKSNYSYQEYNDAYTEENVLIVQSLYKEDFERFNYTKVFRKLGDLYE
jgi:hypothetical protein